MRSLLVAAAVVSAQQLTASQQFATPARTGSLGGSVSAPAPFPAPAPFAPAPAPFAPAPAPAPFASAPAASASTSTTAAGSVADRQFLFANPAADAIALDALRPNATNPFLSLLIAGSIDSNSNNNGYGGGFGGSFGGGYQQPYRPPYNPYPTYPTYPSYPSSYPSYPTYPTYPSYPSSYPSYPSSYPTYPSSYPSYPSYSSYSPPRNTGGGAFPNPPNDPLKQAIILQGIQQGTINSVAAVGLDRNPDINGLGAAVFNQLGNTPLTTALAVSGGLGGSNYYSQFGGNVFGQGSGSGVGNYLFYNQISGGTSPFGR